MIVIQKEKLISLIQAAYIRGADWYRRNNDEGFVPAHWAYVDKAAYDYADKTIHALVETIDDETVCLMCEGQGLYPSGKICETCLGKGTIPKEWNE
jgi:RecJ-like exonuclease